jgi:hypothetical protein
MEKERGRACGYVASRNWVTSEHSFVAHVHDDGFGNKLLITLVSKKRERGKNGRERKDTTRREARNMSGSRSFHTGLFVPGCELE